MKLNLCVDCYIVVQLPCSKKPLNFLIENKTNFLKIQELEQPQIFNQNCSFKVLRVCNSACDNIHCLQIDRRPLTLQIDCSIVTTELKNPTWKTGSCRSMKPKCPGQSFSPLLQVMHVASFWFTPCKTGTYVQSARRSRAKRGWVIIGSEKNITSLWSSTPYGWGVREALLLLMA